MRLYHFTCRLHLRSIMAKGLTRGDVPVTPDEGFNAVWFTSRDKVRRGEHGLSTGFVDKTAVRIAVDLDAADPLLVKWSDWALYHVEPWWREILDDVGGGAQAAARWYFYRGTIAPEQFAEVRT